MDKETLEHLHICLLDIMSEVDRICSENSIGYSLIGGSMIGAVRHHGFIPWDDDMDIGMLRQDYEKFISICESRLDKKYFLQTYDSDPKYNYGYAKMLLNGTELVEFGHERTKYRKGIFVDIFPFDTVPNNIGERKKQKRSLFFLQKILRQKSKIADSPNWGLKEKIFARFLDLIATLSDRNSLVKKMKNIMVLYNDLSTDYICNLSGMYGYDKEIIKREYFDSLIRVPFEDRYFLIMREYDECLTKLYGDYMRLPPENKRITHGYLHIYFNG